ncbi:ImmA/IrrE family metallo-endopeptidase [Psychrobacter proteolyticus]|uniref:ImmA/IrrE family metallo-endopeptidase n=1 Tax=Psychrobacter proteolyticus TaxID=147825 RepID=A0ABV0D733_9GAMM
MASRQLVTHSPKALTHYRKQMSLSVDLLAKKSNTNLKKVLIGETESEVFTVKQLESIAKTLILPTYYLTMDKVYSKNIPKYIDHRNYSDKNSDDEDLYELNKLISEVYKDRENLLHVYDAIEESLGGFQLSLLGNNAQEDAKRIRDFLDVDNARLTVEGSDYYKSWRLLLEKKDVLVLEKSRLSIGSEGLSLFYDVLPIIVIITSGQTPSRKLFTLIHELVHLGLRQSALDGYILEANNKTENYCNEVAGHVLVPTSVINEIYDEKKQLIENIEHIRKAIKVSYDAIAIQLKQVGKISQNDLNTYFANKQKEMDEKDSGFRASYKKHTTYNHFGKIYIQQVFSAVWEDALSLGSAMRILGIEKMSDLDHLEKKAFT